MAPSTMVHLPNGQNLTVTPVFGGLFFKSNDTTNSHSPFPAGWTIVLNSENEPDPELENVAQFEEDLSHPAEETRQSRMLGSHRYKQPTLNHDHLYISSIS